MDKLDVMKLLVCHSKLKSMQWCRAEQTCLEKEECLLSEDKIPQVSCDAPAVSCVAPPVSCDAPCFVEKTYNSMSLLEELQRYKDMVDFFQDGMHVANNKLKITNDALIDTKRTLDIANDTLKSTTNLLQSCISANNYLLATCNDLEKELSDVRAQLLQQTECEYVLPDDIVEEVASTTQGLNKKQNVHSHTNGGDGIELHFPPKTLCNNAAKKRIFSHVNNTNEVCGVALMPAHKKMKQECLCPCVKFDTFFNKHSGGKLLVLCKYECIVLDKDKHRVTPSVSRIHTAPNSMYPTITRNETPFVGIIPIASRSKCHSIIRLETLVRNAIDGVFSGFIHNKTLCTGRLHSSHNRRIDHRLLMCKTILAIETDEYAHRSYTNASEMERYHDFMRSFDYKFVFIRFNPHANTEKRGRKTSFKHKLRVLMHNISIQMDRIRIGHNTKRLEIIKLFY